jgi:5S rRNA maturation endonuclease (ribonuclease M5)
MGIAEQMLFLQSNKDILIVEGKTDEMYIAQALKILKQDNKKYQNLDFNFLWLNGSDSDTLSKIINEFKIKDNQTIIAFFDSDDSGWKCIKDILSIKTDKKFFTGGIKNGIYIELYPKKEGFTNNIFEVEDYFSIEILKKFIFNKSKAFQDLKGKFNNKRKIEFANKCQEHDFEKDNFKGFKTFFDKILSIKEKAGK